MAEFNLGQVAFFDKGVFSLSETYTKWDFATTTDSTYLCVSDTPIIGKEVTNTTYWKCIANGNPATIAAALAVEKAGDANNAADLANTKAGLANDAAILANAKAIYANDQGDYAKAQGDAANTAAGVANSAKGWTPLFLDVADGLRMVRKLDSYFGGTGDAPTLNVGKYLKSDGTYTSVIADAANYKGVTGEVSNAILINTEEAVASVLNALNGRIEALEKVITQGTLTQSQIGTLDVQALNYQGSEMTLSGVGVPAVIPDFIGQRYVQLGVKVWESVGISSVADWK